MSGSGEVTIYEVARRAGVSISTVSLSLNRPQRVSVLTRERVLRVVEELGFVPKETAVARARRGVGRIGVLAPFTSYPTYGRRLQGVLEALRDTTIEVVVYDHESAAAALSPLLESLPLSRHLDGIIVMGLPLQDTTAERLVSSRLPSVLVDTAPRQSDAVSIDDAAAGAVVGRYLVAKGHRRIAYVHEPQRSQEFVSSGQHRIAGLRQAVVEAGGSATDVDVVVVGQGGHEGGREAARRVMDGPWTATFANHDVIASGMLMQLREDGVDVPGRMAVVGFDDGELAEAVGLTTVRQPFEESGRAAAQLIKDALSGQRRELRQLTLPVELVERASA